MIDRSLNYGRHHIARFLKDSAPISRALDLGAGYGSDLLAVRDVCPDAELFAVELHVPMRRTLESRGGTVWPLDLERETLPVQDEIFDVVIANQIFEHVKEIFWVLHESTRALQVGGHLLVGVPNLAAFHNRMLLMFGRQPTPINSTSAHVRGFTRHDLLRLLETCFSGGYRLEAFGGSNFYPFPPWLARPLAWMLPNMAWGIFLRLQKVRTYKDEFIRFLHNSSMQTSFFDGRSTVLSAKSIGGRST